MLEICFLLLDLLDIRLGICNSGIQARNFVFQILYFKGKLTSLQVDFVDCRIFYLYLVERAKFLVHGDAVGIIHALCYRHEGFPLVDRGNYCLFNLFCCHKPISKVIYWIFIFCCAKNRKGTDFFTK